MQRWQQTGWRRDLGLMLWVLAMAVRALVPTGFMLAPANADDGVHVVLCSGFGPVDAEWLPSGEVLQGTALEAKHATDAAAKHKAPCVGAALAHALIAPDAITSLPEAPATYFPALQATAATTTHDVPGLPQKRGPPTTL